MKQFKFLLFMLLGIGILATSCDDDFSEEDLLNAQNARVDSVKADNIRALNEAGELVGLQLKIVNTDGSPVEGLDVSIAASIGSGGLDEQSTTTNASGLALFSRVAIGGNVINISGGSILPVSLDANFGEIDQGTHYQVVNGVIIPTPVTETAIITVLGSSNATATVQGNVQVEADLTNNAPEVPQNVTLIADFDDNLTIESSFNIGYFFATNDNALNVGTAQVDNTTGAYTMTVPAGVNFNIIVPTVSLSQRMAIGSVSGTELERPEYRDVEANFGSSFGTSGIPFVEGVRVVFDTPNAGGSGFALNNFQRVPRDQGYTVGVPTTKSDQGSEVWQFTSLGSGYIASPAVTITDATATNTYAEAHLAIAITGLSLSDAGSGYAASTTYFFDLTYDEIFDNGDGTTGTNTDVVENFSTIGIETDGSGVFTTANINAALADAIDNGFDYFDANDLESIGDNVSNLRLINSDETTDAIIDISSAEGRISNFFFTGENFTNPSFAFSGGGGSSQAAVTVEWASQWAFDLDNTNTTAYSALPSISFEFFDADVPTDVFTSSNVQVYDIDGNFITTTALVNQLTLNGAGEVIADDATVSFRTSSLSIIEPNPIVQDPQPGTTAEARANINSDGQVTSITSINNGSGYTNEFGATIEPSADGAPGSGATVILTGGSFNTDGTFSWFGGSTVTNQGSEYLQDLNLINDNGGTRGFSTGDRTDIRLNEGDTYIFNIDYGTGFRAITYGGFNP